uniref:Vesicular integral-membrane protein VIP36-like n=1 Tax=Sinocyclocheilus grahami TaxID=75366 RepID=A0A672NH54_SINGR
MQIISILFNNTINKCIVKTLMTVLFHITLMESKYLNKSVGTSSSSQWDFRGSTLVTSQYVRLTPDERSKQGNVHFPSLQPCYLMDWEMHVQFKIHGSGKKNLHGDGFAIWYTKDRLHPGPVFGNQDHFVGLAIFVDTFRNDLQGMDRSFPYISAMVNNGSLPYDHGQDGRSTELGGCSVEVRNQDHDTYLAIRYSKGRLTVRFFEFNMPRLLWKECIDIGGVRLPTGYYFGASAECLAQGHLVLKVGESAVHSLPPTYNPCRAALPGLSLFFVFRFAVPVTGLCARQDFPKV